MKISFYDKLIQKLKQIKYRLLLNTKEKGNNRKISKLYSILTIEREILQISKHIVLMNIEIQNFKKQNGLKTFNPEINEYERESDSKTN